MKYSWGLVLSFLLLAGCHTSKRPVLFDLADEDQPVNLAVLQQQYPGAASVYLFHKRDISHDLKPDFTNNAPRWYFFEAYHWSEMTLEDADTSNTHYLMDFALASYEKVRSVDYQVTRPDGSTQHLSKHDMKKERISGDSTRFWIEADDLPAGSVIEATYEIERGDLYKHLPLSHDVALQLQHPALNLGFSYTYPWHWNVQVKEIGLEQSLALNESQNDRAETNTLSYSDTQVPAFEHRHFGPYLKEVAPYFHVQVNRMEIGNVLVYDAPADWSNIAQRYAHHADKPSRKDQNAIRNVLASLELDEYSSDTEKVDVILTHVRDEITTRHRGSISDVIKHQAGNAYAVTQYTRALLEEAGVSTAYMISHSAEGGNFDDAFVSDEQLYRPLIKATMGGQMVYLFPSLAGVPAGYIPSEYEHQPAIVYGQTGFEGFGALPQTTADAFARYHTYEVFVNSDGETRVAAAMEMGHHGAYYLAQLMAAGMDEKELVQQLLPHDHNDVSGLTYKVKAGSWDQPTVIEAKYGLSNCVKQDGSQIVLKSCGFFDASQDAWSTTSAPRSSMARSRPVDFENKVVVNYPAAWTLLTNVQGIAETTENGRFARSVQQEPGMLEVLQSLSYTPQAGVMMTDRTAAPMLPARAALPLLELTTAPVYTAGATLEEVEPGGPWTLVLASYETIKDAETAAAKYRTDLAESGYQVTVLVDGNTPDEFRLVLGTFATRTGIETAREVLGQDIPFDSWMLSLKPQMTAVSGAPMPVMH